MIELEYKDPCEPGDRGWMFTLNMPTALEFTLLFTLNYS